MQLRNASAFLLLLPALALTPAPADAQRDETVERVIELGRTDSRVQEHLDYLVNRIGPRLTSSSNLERAEQWAVQQLRSWGLDARLERWGEFAVGFDRYPWSGRILARDGSGDTELEFTTPAWTPGTPGPVRGHAMLKPETAEELDARRDEFAGAWILTRPRDMRGSRDDRQAVDEGLAEIAVAGEIRRTSHDTLVHTGGRSNVEWDDLPTRVSIRLQGEQFDALQKRLVEGERVELEFDIDNRFRRGPIPLYNVIADIVGTEFPDEIVLVGGHLDSWDGATGTNDNGTGVSTTLEAARLLMESGARPRRTIRFALWSGEEQGLLGSRAYVEAHPELMEKISAVLIHDGGTNYLSGIAGPPALADELRWAFEPVVDLDAELPFEVVENEGLNARGGSSDHAPFVQAGVPGFFWQQSGRSSYPFVHHTQNDVFEHAIAEYQRHSAMVVAVGAYNLAQLDEPLDRTGLIRKQAPRRLMGVFLEDTTITGLTDGGKAQEAGWKEGDVIVSIDGVAVANRGEVGRELRRGGPLKTIVLQRGEETFESTLDYSDLEPEEPEETRTAEAAEPAKQDDETPTEAPVPAGGAPDDVSGEVSGDGKP